MCAGVPQDVPVVLLNQRAFDAKAQPVMAVCEVELQFAQHSPAFEHAAFCVSAPAQIVAAPRYSPVESRLSAVNGVDEDSWLAAAIHDTPSRRTQVSPVVEKRDAADAPVAETSATKVPAIDCASASLAHSASAASRP